MVTARTRVERAGFRALYRLADLTYALGIATPKRTVAGTYWSYEPTNPHGDDPGLAALDALAGDATIVDVGAHVGEHAIPLALDTDRRVVAIEPNGESADRLARNARRNGLSVGVSDGSDIDLRRVGAGDTAATLSFYRSTFSKLSAFDRDRATRWGAEVDAVESVPVHRIDALAEGVDRETDVEGAAGGGATDSRRAIPAPDALKVDVEGHELAVLRGGRQTIERHRPLLVVEVHDHGESRAVRDLRDWLAARDYAIEEAEDVWICRG